MYNKSLFYYLIKSLHLKLKIINYSSDIKAIFNGLQITNIHKFKHMYY